MIGTGSGVSASSTISTGLARRARLAAVAALHASGGGHYGGVLSVIDLLAALHVAAPLAPGGGDRLVLSKGHAVAALYAILVELGWLDAPLDRYGALDAGLEGHPDMTTCSAIQFSTGSLGQGLAAGLGMALALRHTEHHVWVVLGDGECQEGQIWEAAMLASRYRLARLHAIIDANGAQECGWSHDPRLDPTPLPAALSKWQAFGWQASALDGHDHDALAAWIGQARRAPASGAPAIAVARTIKGFGVQLFREQPARAHSTELTAGEYDAAYAELSR